MVDQPGGVAGLDADTIRRAVVGDRAALGDIWTGLNPALVRFLGSLGVLDPDDLAASVWVELARRMPKVDPDPVALRTLLLTIGRRRAIDAHRRATRRAETLVADLAVDLPVDDGTDRVDDAVVAQALLDQLPRAQREVVTLRFVVGLSAAEVGAVTGQREGAVRVMTLRALRRLRELAVAAGLGPEPAEIAGDPSPAPPDASRVTRAAAPAMVES